MELKLAVAWDANEISSLCSTQTFLYLLCYALPSRAQVHHYEIRIIRCKTNQTRLQQLPCWSRDAHNKHFPLIENHCKRSSYKKLSITDRANWLFLFRRAVGLFYFRCSTAPKTQCEDHPGNFLTLDVSNHLNITRTEYNEQLMQHSNSDPANMEITD